MNKTGSKKRIGLIAAIILCVAAALGCLLAIRLMPKKLVSQFEAQRWQGDGALKYAQTTVFTAVDSKLALSDIYSTREKLAAKMHEAALDIDNDAVLITDAWSTEGSVSVYSGYGSGEASVVAVGGNYFDFHPIKLIDGCYINEDDLMHDRVLLDEDLAWLLFGGTELQGLSLSINNRTFYVAGVIRREQDFASRKAYTDGMGLFMSYDVYCELFENAGISCYEVVMPQPVKKFAISTMEGIFNGSKITVLDNTNRFGFPALFRVLGSLASRTMQNGGMDYPYWENASRYLEFHCALLLLAGLVLLVFPLVCFVMLCMGLFKQGKHTLEEELVPKVKDNVEEFFRVRGRRRWERRHGKHEL